MKCEQEGLVLTYVNTFTNQYNVKKWKTAVEPQGMNPDILKEILKNLDECEFTKNNSEFDKIKELINKLYQVSTVK